MRIHVLGLAALLLISIGCEEESAAPMHVDLSACCDDGTVRTLREACRDNEIAQPLERCEERISAMDAGTMEMTCGDGVFDDTLEGCDVSAENAGCPLGLVCEACACVDRCGDDAVQPGEQCERNPACAEHFDTVCRQCQCVLSSIAVRFDDEESDIEGAELASVLALDLHNASMTISGPPEHEFSIELGGRLRRPERAFRVCIVVGKDQIEHARLCFVQPPDDLEDVVFTRLGEAPRSVADHVSVQLANRTLHLKVGLEAGLPVGGDLGFYWFTQYGEDFADRLPDEGLLPMSDIVGR